MKRWLGVMSVLPFLAWADTETVDGIEWTYSVRDDEATVGSGEYYTSAIPSNTLGAITVPQTLGGCPVTRIGEDAFYDCKRLTAVTIPSCVTSIGGYAFAGCRGIKSVTIPACVARLSSTFPDAYSTITDVIIADGVTSVGADAFRNCSRLTSVVIPESVTSIGASAFYGCGGLKAVGIPSGVTSIGGSAFYNCDSLTSVTIPSGVTSIEYGTFYNCSGLKSLNIPSGVTRIGGSAFYGCSGLSALKIPAGVTSIGTSAFYGCKGVKTLAVPSGVTSIEYGTFYNCSGLTSVTIPSSVTSIGGYAFCNCGGLTSVALPSALTCVEQGVFYGCSGLKSLNISSRVTSIGASAFYNCSGLTSLRIPSGVTSIGSYAFSDCSGLTSISIPFDVTCIEDSTFRNCSGLTSVDIPSRVVSIGASAFYNCTGLTSVTIPSGVTSIGSSAFSGCSGLTSISIPSGVTCIEDSTFRNCRGLTSVDIPAKVTRVGNYAFYNCRGLTSLTIPSSVTSIGDYAFCDCDGLTSIAIPSGVASIGSFAFRYCNELMSVTLSSGVASIGRGAFSDCNKLTAIAVDSGNNAYVSSDGILYGKSKKDFLQCPAGKAGTVTILSGVTRIGDYAFSGCRGLTSVSIPSTVTDMGEYAFYSCSSLTSVAIPSSVTSIGDYAFSSCSRLTSVTIPSKVTRVGASAFSYCDGLTAVAIPSSVTSIGSSAFARCSGLTTISVDSGNKAYASSDGVLYNKSKTELIQCPCGKTGTVSIPSSVTSIGESAFYGCSGLTSVSIPTKVTSIGSSVFYGCSGLTSVKIPSGVTSIGSYSFDGCSGLASVTIPSGVTSIGSYAFYRCGGLKSVTVPEAVTSIGSYAFSGCTNLTSVTIPEGVTSIAYDTFYGCSGLTTAKIPDSVRSIGSSAFCNCGRLTSVTIPAGVTSVGSSAFSGCSALRRVRVRGESESDVDAMRRKFAASGFEDAGVTFNLYDVRYAAFAANGYDGLISDANGNFVGFVHVSLSKQNDNTGVVTATATVTDENGMAWSYSGGAVEILSAPPGATADAALGVVTGLKCSSLGCPVVRFDVVLDGNGLEGDWGGNAIAGTRNGGGGADDPMAEVLERCKGKWSVTIGRQDGGVTALRMQLNVQAKGVVKVAGNWESGEAVSVSAQMVMLGEVAYVPLTLKATKTTSALMALFQIEGDEITLVSAKDPAQSEDPPCQLIAGGRTTSAIAISGYLAEDPGAAGADYVGRVAINELAYPAKFTQKGLPAGLKLNASTGVVSGKPTKPGFYDVIFTATSAANSKSNDMCRVVIQVNNYADPNIVVADSYGPYTPGVSCRVEIPEANGCTVSGLPSGLKWAAKEIRAKDGSLTAAADSVYGIPTKPGNYTVYFKKKIAEVNDKGKTVMVEHVSTSTFVVADYPTITIGPVLASDGIVRDIPLADGTNLVFVVGVAQSVALNLEGTLDGVATTVTARGLPSGLKLVKTAVYVDPNAKKKVVDHYEYTIEGAPTAVSKVSGKTKTVTPSHVALSASNKYKWSGAFAFDVTVAALPSWAVGNFSGTIAAPDGSYHGTVTLTVGKAGKISGKLAAQGTNWTYSAMSYAGWDVAGATNFTVEAVAKSGKRERSVVLALADLVRNEPIPGIFEATATGAFGGDGADLRRIVWKDAGGKALASEYAGAYTYADAGGEAYSITVAESGTAKLVGYVNGKKTTLSTSLLTDIAEDGGLVVCGPFYKAPGKSGKTMTPEFYRFVELQNYHTEPAVGGVASRDPGSILSVDETWSGSGKVSASPKYGQAAIGKPVTLTASPDSKSLFVKWVVVDAKGNVVPGDPYAKKFKYVVGEEDVFASAAFLAKADEPAKPTVLNADAIRAAFAECVVGMTVDVALEVPDAARPVTFSAKNLPPGLKLDTATGRITGTAKAAGTKEVEITLKTQRGTKPSVKFSFTSIVN